MNSKQAKKLRKFARESLGIKSDTLQTLPDGSSLDKATRWHYRSIKKTFRKLPGGKDRKLFTDLAGKTNDMMVDALAKLPAKKTPTDQMDNLDQTFGNQ